MKKLLLSISILITLSASGQKLGDCKYKKVDTVFSYNDATVICYNQNSNPIKDTILNKTKCSVLDIEESAVIINMGTSLSLRVFKPNTEFISQQDMDEVGVILMKAFSIYELNRYDDIVKQINAIISVAEKRWRQKLE